MERNETESEALDALLRQAQVSSAAPHSPGSPFDAVDSLDAAVEPGPGELRPALLDGIHLKVRAELGRSRIPLKEALKLGPGSVLDLGKFVDDPVDLYVGELRIARGEVHVVNDSFCIRITEVFSQGGGEEGS